MTRQPANPATTTSSSAGQAVPRRAAGIGSPWSRRDRAARTSQLAITFPFGHVRPLIHWPSGRSALVGTMPTG
jgi:hypothetical protein